MDVKRQHTQKEHRMKTNNGLKKAASVASLAGLLLVMVARPAWADSQQTNTLAFVNVYENPLSNNGSGLSLQIQLGGTNFFAQVTALVPASCNAASVDEIKIWASLGQSALLAGKKVTLSYKTCSNTINYITGVLINP
jgi:hypothetical protein